MQDDLELNLDKILDFTKTIIYLDIESTQHSFLAPKIIQIAAIKTINHQIIDEMNYWSDPRQKIEPRILKMVGKNQDFFNNKKSNSFVYQKLLEFIGKNEQIVVFGDYDQVVLNFQAKRFLASKINLIDIQKLFYSKIINSQRNQISLRLAAISLGVEDLQKEVHDALLDSKMLFYIVEASRVANLVDLRNNFLLSMIIPRKKEFRANKDFQIRKVNLDFDVNFKLNYFTINYHKKIIPNEESSDQKTFINKIDCEFYQFNQNPKEHLKVIYNHEFNELNQDSIQQKIQEFCLEVIDNYMKDSIFIYKSGFQDLCEIFRKEYNALPGYYYIPYGHFELYIKDIHGITSIKSLLANPVKLSLILEIIKSKISNI